MFSASYKNAQKALKLAEIGEDIPSHLTTDDEQMGKRMRKKKRLSMLSSAEEDADDGDSDVSIPYPPTVLKHKKSIPEGKTYKQVAVPQVNFYLSL